jgi:hypothetical protein
MGHKSQGYPIPSNAPKSVPAYPIKTLHTLLCIGSTPSRHVVQHVQSDRNVG